MKLYSSERALWFCDSLENQDEQNDEEYTQLSTEVRLIVFCNCFITV